MSQPVISVMLAVPDTPQAVGWYKRALGAAELWNFGSVAGLEIAGAVFFFGGRFTCIDGIFKTGFFKCFLPVVDPLH